MSLFALSQLRMHSFYGTYLHLTQCVHLQRREHKCALSDMIDNRTPLCALCVYPFKGFFKPNKENYADRKEISFVFEWHKVCFHVALGIAELRKQGASLDGLQHA